MARKLVLLSLALAVLVGGCAGLQVKDPARTSLYAVKAEWLSIREYVIQESYAGRISDVQVADFKRADGEFSFYYNLALTAFLAGTDNAAVFDRDMGQLKKLLLDARRRFYPNKTGGGA